MYRLQSLPNLRTMLGSKQRGGKFYLEMDSCVLILFSGYVVAVVGNGASPTAVCWSNRLKYLILSFTINTDRCISEGQKQHAAFTP